MKLIHYFKEYLIPKNKKIKIVRFKNEKHTITFSEENILI